MAEPTGVLAPNFTTDPYWWDAAPPETARDPLPEETDILVVGSGYCGLSAAAELARNGVDVTVVDAEELGAGASTRSGGMVSSGQKLVIGGAIKGVDAARMERLLEDSLSSYEHLKSLIREKELDADLGVFGRYFGAHVPGHYDRLRRHGELLAKHTGVTVHEIPKSRQHEITKTDFYHGGIVIDDYGGLHPAKYHRALRRLAQANGAKLRSHAPVLKVGPLANGFHEVETGRGMVRARHVFFGTNGYSDKASGFLHKRIVGVRSYQIATEPLPPELMAEINPGRRMITDSKRELIYTRPSPDGTRILFGSRPGMLNVPEREAAPRLHAMMLKVWPQLAGYKVTHCWSGKVGMTADKIAHMGKLGGIDFAVGCNGNGVALMTYLGHQSALKLLGKQNRRSAFDDPAFPEIPVPLYDGRPWFLPIVSGWYHLQDAIDRRLARF
ncbi:glycine/D-amino acid oxidase-like deaminating enzyme [Bosea sp. OAE752]|uniref:NAD(P)/FAD-dependent oxidoreductase n=1 Tax=unclassified Bosea (in: a-proteobacteria) TaxID=2653178 RepID=UPI001154B8A0